MDSIFLRDSKTIKINRSIFPHNVPIFIPPNDQAIKLALSLLLEEFASSRMKPANALLLLQNNNYMQRRREFLGASQLSRR